MKRILLLLSLALLLCGCSREETQSGIPKDEGVAPYELSQDQQELLGAFGMEDSARLFAFLAPEEAITIEVTASRLTAEGSWEVTGSGAMSIGTERQPVSELSGTIAMELGDDHSIDFNINCAGRGSFSSEKIELEQEPLGSTKAYLTEFQAIELNEEIPLALMVYDSGTSMRSYTAGDYFDVSLFEGMDLVQAVTVRFTDREIGE